MMEVSHSWRHRLRRYWIILPLLLVMLLMAIPELENMGFSMPWTSDPCALQEADQGGISTKLYLPLTRWVLHSNPSPTVALIYIDPTTEPAEILTNTCAARVFLARLVQVLNDLHANVIVIDKYYSDNSCTEQEPNDIFLNAMNQSQVPVVVGQPTHKLSSAPEASRCLALSKRFDFGKQSKVQYGLTRLNSDTLKIPLRWPVFQESDKPGVAPTQIPEASGVGDSLSLVAARQRDPNIEKSAALQKLLAMHIHPYTTFRKNLPNTNAMVVLCSSETNPHDAYGKPFGDACKGMARPLGNLDNKNLSLDGKVVVIGDKSDADMQPFPGGEDKPGVFLQANYIQSLLDHRFLNEVPLGLTLIGLILFILGIYGLYWILPPERALIASLVIFLTVIFVSFAALVIATYYTPLWALWGAGILVVFRYLETRAHHFSKHLSEQEIDHADEKP
jgi:hypothetical protein